MTLKVIDSYFPKMAEQIQIEESGNDFILFDPSTKLFHLLNTTSYIILKSCDGNNNINKITSIVCNEFDISNSEEIIDDVNNTILQFKKKGILS